MPSFMADENYSAEELDTVSGTLRRLCLPAMPRADVHISQLLERYAERTGARNRDRTEAAEKAEGMQISASENPASSIARGVWSTSISRTEDGISPPSISRP